MSRAALPLLFPRHDIGFCYPPSEAILQSTTEGPKDPAAGEPHYEKHGEGRFGDETSARELSGRENASFEKNVKWGLYEPSGDAGVRLPHVWLKENVGEHGEEEGVGTEGISAHEDGVELGREGCVSSLDLVSRISGSCLCHAVNMVCTACFLPFRIVCCALCCRPLRIIFCALCFFPLRLSCGRHAFFLFGSCA